MGMVPRWPCLKVNKMNILATYANSYVGAFDVALSARSEHTSARSEQMAGKTRETAGNRGFRKLFTFGNRTEVARAA